MSVRRSTFVLAVTVPALLAGTSLAKSSISSAFDGSYRGSVTAIAWLSAGECSAPVFDNVTIAKGMVSATAAKDNASLNAIVTEEGFVTGRVTYANGAGTPIEGRIVGGQFVGGLLSDNGRCAWLVKFGA